jgi:hypothetical protein
LVLEIPALFSGHVYQCIFSRKKLKKRDHLINLGIDGRIILKWIARNGSILRIGIGRLL